MSWSSSAPKFFLLAYHLERQGSLPDCRQHFVELERRPVYLKREPAAPGGGEQKGVVVTALQLVDTGVDITPQIEYLQIGPPGQDLAGASRTAGPDHSALWEAR